jgi:hypothetical protein
VPGNTRRRVLVVPVWAGSDVGATDARRLGSLAPMMIPFGGGICSSGSTTDEAVGIFDGPG